MKRVCAWCRREMGTVENSSRPDTEVSRGICEQCVENFSFQQGVPYQSYIDSLPLPVLLVAIHADQYIITKSVNRKAGEMLGKRTDEMIQHLVGNVFECAHARLPEGCGRTMHCSGCTIRKSVLETFRTGEPRCMVPATFKRSLPDRQATAELFITTVKTGNMVLLRVDEITERAE